ncbi:MAG: Cys-tRNA(Pro) deacylase [Sandaracinaceae bacterium]|nr:Cys-tRNA(Pro) deacylase [Sandaracinaceae bacterium]
MKTNAARLLDKLEVAYEIREYEVDESDLSAPSVAKKVGLEPAQVFKTLVVRGEPGGVGFAVVAADAELDLKALARGKGDRKVQLVPLKEVQPLTGYIRGGVTALGAKKTYPVVLDESALAFARIAVSAGVRGAQLVLDPRDYARAVSAKLGAIQRREAKEQS